MSSDPPASGSRPPVTPTAGQVASAVASTGTRLDPHIDRYAARVSGMTASEIRALFAVATRPEVVSLAGGMPFTAALSMEAVGAMLQRMMLDRGAAALQYGSGQGDRRLRELICGVMALEGVSAVPDDVIVTVGSQQALDLMARVFLDPGDVVLAEGPSYVGALGTFTAYQADVVHVPMDDDGLIPEALRQTLESVRASGRRAKFLYTVPNFHNPAGVTLSVQRRAEILQICQTAGLLVLEDNPYGLLGFDGDVYPALRSLTSEGVIYLGSFSKTIAPGLRVGWAVAPRGVREKLILASEAGVLCPPNFTQFAVAEYLQNQPWQEQVKDFRELYRERRDAMLGSLSQLLGTCTWTVPKGGFYVWATLPEGLDAKEMLPRAVAARVAFVPGSAFFADGSGHQHMRLSYCYPTPERIREGIRRLASVVEEEAELLRTFGPVGQHSGGRDLLPGHIAPPAAAPRQPSG